MVNRTAVIIKNGYYLKLLTAEMRKVLRSTKRKTANDKNGENVPHLEINKVVLVHFNIVNNDYQQDLEVLYTLISNK